MLEHQVSNYNTSDRKESHEIERMSIRAKPISNLSRHSRPTQSTHAADNHNNAIIWLIK